MLEILNSNQFASPIIVFVNQKKTADMVAKDLHRAGVYIHTLFDLHSCSRDRLHSGVPLRSIPERTKNNERPPCSPSVLATRIFSWLLILLVVVSTCRMSRWSSTTRCPIPLRHTSTVSVHCRQFTA